MNPSELLEVAFHHKFRRYAILDEIGDEFTEPFHLSYDETEEDVDIIERILDRAEEAQIANDRIAYLIPGDYYERNYTLKAFESYDEFAAAGGYRAFGFSNAKEDYPILRNLLYAWNTRRPEYTDSDMVPFGEDGFLCFFKEMAYIWNNRASKKEKLKYTCIADDNCNQEFYRQYFNDQRRSPTNTLNMRTHAIQNYLVHQVERGGGNVHAVYNLIVFPERTEYDETAIVRARLALEQENRESLPVLMMNVLDEEHKRLESRRK